MKTKQRLLSAVAALCLTTFAAQAENTVLTQFITGNDVGMVPGHANHFTAFAPELPAMLARMPEINPETGLHVSEIKPGLFFVTEGVYQSAFLETNDGVIVFDAPPSFAHKLPETIAAHAPGKAINYLVYSHGHSDHIGGANIFGEVDGLQIIAHADVAESLSKSPLPGVLEPTLIFMEPYEFTFGSETVKLTPASFHAEDTDTIIYLPGQNFVMAVDTITPGEVPFMNFGATSDIGAYMTFFDTILEYDFDYILSGHVSALGTRDDVIIARGYAQDVWQTAISGMESFYDSFNEAFATIEYKNANLAYRVAIESIRRECAGEIIDRWDSKLSVVDVWADSHCQTVILHKIMH